MNDPAMNPLNPASPHEGSSPRPPRRIRYSGKNPRRFSEKYKEHTTTDPTILAKVVASGKTPAGTHRPILVQEILDILKPQPGKRFVDCTLGYGGHASELLKHITPGGCLIGLDADPIELPKTTLRLREAGWSEAMFRAVRTNFAALPRHLADAGWTDGADGILADLGVSSMQLDDPSRGFTFKEDGPLDLRLNPQKGLPAADWLARTPRNEMIRVFQEYADEPAAEKIATAILEAQRKAPLRRTRALAQVVRAAAIPNAATPAAREAADLAVRRVFQALRIAINDEFGVLDLWLRNLPACLRSGGRVAVLSFHSGEDRRGKHAFASGLRDGIYSQVNESVVRPSPEEMRSNSRSTSAKLRWAIRH